MGGSRAQVNKAHKSRFSSKSSRNINKTSLKDKSRIAKSERNVAKGARAARIQRNNMLREQKRAALLKMKRASGSSTSPPRVVLLFGLSASVDVDSLSDDLLKLLSDNGAVPESSTVASNQYKLRVMVLKAPHGDLLSCMEMAKVADLIGFVASSNSSCDETDSDYVDSFGSQCLSLFRLLGLPSTVVFIRDLPDDLKRKNDSKKICISSLAREFPEDCKFYPADTRDELPKMLKLLIPSSPARQSHHHFNSSAIPFLNTLTRRHSFSHTQRAFLCSDSTDSFDSSSSSAIVPTNPRPEDFLTVLALPLPHRPLFPGFYMPIYVKDPKLLAALQESRKRQAPYAGAFLVKDEPGTDPAVVTGSEAEKNINELKGKDLLNRLHDVGTLAQITSIQGDQVILIGHRRLRITEMVSEDPLTVKVDHLKDKPYNKDDDVIKATSFEVVSTLRDVLKTSSLWRDHVQTYTQHIGDFNFSRLADFGAAISGANKLQCQEVLEELDIYKRLRLTLELVKKEMEISKIQESIAKAIEEKISGEQRRYLLNEQMKAIKKELGLETDDKTALSAKFRERIEPNREKIPAHVLQVIDEELTKLQLLEASSSEFNVTRNYLDWLTVLPWGSYSDENFDVLRAQKILDEDHYGLKDVKERILEFIAVGKLRGTSQGKIICLSGPPGVGKTSIGRSIARALNRKFFRFSVGGLSDVAEIKGHRRTYIGAMPGKMVQCLKSVGTANPLVLIDEIDKLGRGHAGDPASALLELLDPEQNANFLDHYLDVPIDLSKVLFVCTANVVDMIPNPLLDRMEVIPIAGYITDEKMHIARDYLEKTARESCGLKPEQVEVTDSALLSLIENYCREAGVRNLQKQIEKIYRKIALQLVRQGAANETSASKDEIASSDKPKAEQAEVSAGSVESSSNEHNNETTAEAEILPSQSDISQQTDAMEPTIAEKTEEHGAAKEVEKVLVDASNLDDFVGKPVFHAERIYDQTPVGVVMGLAWTAMGGSTLYIETTLVEQGEGKGALHVTGQLGDVMKESAQIAHTVARGILLEKEPDNHFFTNSKLHLHVPAGATPKDGPSAGCTMVMSLLSLAMKKPVVKDLAMTGEVTLTRKILPIGGVKEKTIAAKRSGVKKIIFPAANKRDFDELTTNVKEGLDVHFAENYGEIFDLAFSDDPK